MSTDADQTIPGRQWASLLPTGMQPAGELSFDTGVVVRRFVHGSYETPDMPACEHHLFAFRLSGQVTAERRLGSVWQRANTRRGSITIVPALNTSAWRLDGKGEILHFYLPPALLQRVWEEEHGFGELPIAECLGAFDPRLATLVETFDCEMRQGIAGYALYAEAVLTQIVICLLRHHSMVRTTGRGSGSLRRAVERRLNDYIEANLQRDISLSALADLADLKPAQFSKLFKATFGFSPYQYVLRRRVEWAKTLLRDGKLGIAEVAVEVGFAHQAHFTTMFKRVCGTTPAAYRAALQT